jgi:hypothetical protein
MFNFGHVGETAISQLSVELRKDGNGTFSLGEKFN